MASCAPQLAVSEVRPGGFAPGFAALGRRKVLLYANTDWYLYNFRQGLMTALREAGLEVVLVAPPGPYGGRLEAQGFRWIPIPMRRTSLNPGTELQLIRRLAAVYRRERPDIVHHFTIKCVVYGSLAARLAGIPVRINAVAGLGTVYSGEDSRNRLLRPLVTRLLRVSLAGKHSHLILQNPDDVSLFRHLRLVSPDRLHLIRGSGVDGSTFRARPAADGGGPCRILFAARLLRSKGVDNYLRAARRLGAAGVAEFLIAGTPDAGNPDAIGRDYLEACSREGTAQLLGHVDRMQELLESVDILVLPSVYGEGVPRILVEGAACGLPLVAFDVPGSREIVVDGENGFLLPPGDQAALEHAIDRLVRDPGLRARMGRASRRHFETEYDQGTVIRKTLEVYAAGVA